jgi:PAS domain-containing protein
MPSDNERADHRAAADRQNAADRNKADRQNAADHRATASRHNADQPRADHQPHPELDELHRRLERARRLADDLSYRLIAKLSPVQLSPTTVNRMFTSAKPPSWTKLRAVLATLGVSPEQVLAEWRPLWIRAANEADPLHAVDVDAEEVLTPVSFEYLVCRKCGARIDDPALHGRFHQWVERIAAKFNALERPSNRVSKSSKIGTP